MKFVHLKSNIRENWIWKFIKYKIARSARISNLDYLENGNDKILFYEIFILFSHLEFFSFLLVYIESLSCSYHPVSNTLYVENSLYPLFPFKRSSSKS